MQVVVLSPADVLVRLAAEHGLESPVEPLSRELLAGVMPSQLARMYPCPASSLLAAARHALEALGQDKSALWSIAEDVLEDLQTCGDVVELARVTVAQDDDKAHWLFPSPPSFVVRGERAYFFGIAPDNAPFLPREQWQRIQTAGAARFMDLTEVGAPTVSSLSASGLRRLDEKEWLGAERNETSAQHAQRLREYLQREGINGPLPGMKVLAHQAYSRRIRPTNSYRTAPGADSVWLSLSHQAP